MSDAPDDPHLLSLAASISTGTNVDWEELRQEAAGPVDADLVSELEVLAGIAKFYRLAGC